MYYNGLLEFSACDNQIEDRYKALFLLNTMRKLGFNSRKKFIDTCVTYSSFDLNTQTLNKFIAFWDGRDTTLIPEVEKIINTITEKKNMSYEPNINQTSKSS